MNWEEKFKCYREGCNRTIDSQRSQRFCAVCLDELWEAARTQWNAKRFANRLLGISGADQFDVFPSKLMTEHGIERR